MKGRSRWCWIGEKAKWDQNKRGFPSQLTLDGSKRSKRTSDDLLSCAAENPQNNEFHRSSVFKNDKSLLWVSGSQQMSAAACYLRRAEGKQHNAAITLRGVGGGRGTLQVTNDQNRDLLQLTAERVAFLWDQNVGNDSKGRSLGQKWLTSPCA